MNDKKIAFITGANRGIGFETAKGLGEKGVFVILGSRDAKKGQEAKAKLAAMGIESESLTFDVTKTADHKMAYEYFQKNFGRLDILVNNAGIARDASELKPDVIPLTTTVSEKVLRETFDSNFFAPVFLTQTLLPLIQKSEAGRIVNLASILGSLTLHSDPDSSIYDSKRFAYNSSKTALNAFTVHLAYELRNTSIKVNSAHPGWVKTDMGGAEAPLEVSDGAKTSIMLALLPANGPTGGFFHESERLPW